MKLDKIKEALGIEELFPIQEKVYEKISEGKNSLIVEAPTGSGKTLAFLLPLLAKEEEEREIRYIILVPTEELGAQIASVIGKVTEKVLFFPSGVGMKRQIDKLKKLKPTFVVGMPERIDELMAMGKIKGDRLKGIIIDEGDKALKGSNREWIEGIFKKAYKTTPVYFFSATFKERDKDFLSRYRVPLDVILLDDRNHKVRHQYILVRNSKKMEVLFKLLRGYGLKKCIVFINRPEGVEGFKRRLFDQRREVFTLHTKMLMNERKKVIEDFRRSDFSMLVTTDVFSRGLDIPDTEGVIHYDLPRSGKAYIHRSGRTGRGYREGIVVTMVEEWEKGDFYRVRHEAGTHMEQVGINREGKIIPVRGHKKQDPVDY